MTKSHSFTAILCTIVATYSYITVDAQQLTRGIGIYPGAPEEYYGPQLVKCMDERNVARGRMVSQSSSIDFNMTAQLLTDGIVGNEKLKSKKSKR